MKLKRLNSKGLTLIEVIVALAILGIMAASFLTVFSSSFSTIFSMGRRTQAINDEAQYYMDLLYEDYSNGITEINGNSNVSIDDSQTLYGMKRVVITVVYEDGRSVTLTSLVP